MARKFYQGAGAILSGIAGDVGVVSEGGQGKGRGEQGARVVCLQKQEICVQGSKRCVRFRLPELPGCCTMHSGHAPRVLCWPQQPTSRSSAGSA